MPRPRPERPVLQLHRGRYAIVWWDGGERRRVSTGTSNPTFARQQLADFEAELDRRPEQLTVDQALAAYEADRTGKVTALGRLKEAARALRAGLGDLRIDQVNQKQWDDYARTRVTRPPRRADPATHRPRPVSTGTLRREFNALRAALRKAWKDGKLLKPPALTPPADSAPRDRYLTKEEARALLGACISPHVRIFTALALYTGARKGSILALTWDRVDFRTGTIDFQEPDRKLTSKRRATVPMNASLRAELLTAKAMAKSGHVIEFNGSPVPHGLRWSFDRLCQRAGLTWRPTPHHLKHSVVSWLAMEGIAIDQAADLLATDPATLRRTYRKFDPTYLRTATAALEL